MSVVNRNIRDMPIPSFSYADRYDGRVFVKSIDDDGKTRKRTIGHMTDSTPGQERMVPNKYFKETYQDLWTEAYPHEKVPRHEMKIGIYALTLGIGMKTGLYSDLRDVYGPEYANNILDYSMFSILHRSGVTQIFEKTMAKEVLFCDKLHGDSWYSIFFSKKLDEDHNHLFRIRYIQRLVEGGLKKVWLSIDGSNNDCEARKSFLAKYGFPKSHNNNKTIVGYMYVVDAETGRPVTYFVYEGSVPDNQAFHKIAVFLGGFRIEIEGVILDRGFAVENVLQVIEERKWKYVIMLPSDTSGHVKMVEEYGDKIRWKSQFALKNDVLFGISDKKKLFSVHQRVSNICLFFDGAGGSLQSVRLIRQIQKARKKTEVAIASGRRAAVEKKLRKYLSIEGDGPDRKVAMNYDAWDEAMSSKGFYSIATSEGISPELANELYKMRDSSETQFSVLKSQEGGSVSRVHRTEGIYSKFAMLFVSSIIRYEIQKVCELNSLDTNPMIQGLESVSLLYSAREKYEAVRNLTTEQKTLFGAFDIEQDDLEILAREFNNRSNTDSKNPDRRFAKNTTSLVHANTHKRGKANVKLEAKETDDTQSTSDLSVPVRSKSKGGRPKGKKDSKPRKPRSDKGIKRGKRSNN